MCASHNVRRAWRFGLLLALAASPAPAADYPAWWSNVVDRTATTNDFAPATDGQLKWMATNAFVELESDLPGGAGAPVRDLVSGFLSQENYYTVNLGQLKYVASLFYDRLIAAGFASACPWTETKSDDADHSVANVGQLKNVFNFSLDRVYADAGIMADSEIRTWWSVASTNVVSPSLQDGGFEQSAPNGIPPPSSGKWSMLTAGGYANACVTTTAGKSGNGLWSYTGTIATERFTVVYQQYPTVGGDRWILSAQIRHPSGNGWVSGTRAFVRLKFLNSLGSNIPGGFVDSPSAVTAANQDWTYCAVTGTASLGAYYVRMELMIEKPEVGGQSVANFDDCFFQKCNGFESNSDAADAQPIPEGARTFRTFAVNTAGWGVFRTNGVANFLAYTNGALRFWLKSAAPSRVEVKSVTGIMTNTSVVGQFANTIENGSPAWQLKSIPVNTMPGVNLSRVSCPFAFTDLGVTNSSFVDCVYWVKTP